MDTAGGIGTDRTYQRADLIALIPVADDAFIQDLEMRYGLLRLGPAEPIYFGHYVVEALTRRAKDKRRHPIRRTKASKRK